MNKIYKVAIVGGGASGLLSAVELLRDSRFLGEDVVILERNDRVGKKLVATGNGQGNLSNSNLSLSFYHGDKNFLSSLKELLKVNLEEYFSNLGIFFTEEEGKKYPVSKQASAVLDIIRSFLSKNNCQTITGFKVDKIIKEKDYYRLISKEKEVLAKVVVLAFGGKASKQFGTDGTSYSLATSLKHNLTPLFPSLVQLKTDTDNIRGLKGIKEKARVTAFDGDEFLSSAVGDILFTDYGVSGSAVFQVSGYAITAKNPLLKIEFLPDLTEKGVEKMLNKKKSLAFIEYTDCLSGIVNKRIGQLILKISKNDVKSIVYNLKNFVLKVKGSMGFDYAQVTKGGISSDNINPNTFESKINKNLYIVGEALDVDGDCGGYNLTFAFLSGIKAGEDIKNKLL